MDKLRPKFVGKMYIEGDIIQLNSSKVYIGKQYYSEWLRILNMESNKDQCEINSEIVDFRT